MKFKVYECSPMVTPKGVELKKLVLQGEGKQYPDKNVTMWSNHPLYATIKAGDVIDAELEVTDTRKPNPYGGTYKNKVVKLPQGTNTATMGARKENDTPLPTGDENGDIAEILRIVRRLESALIAEKEQQKPQESTDIPPADAYEDFNQIPF